MLIRTCLALYRAEGRVIGDSMIRQMLSFCRGSIDIVSPDRREGQTPMFLSEITEYVSEKSPN